MNDSTHLFCIITSSRICKRDARTVQGQPSWRRRNDWNVLNNMFYTIWWIFWNMRMRYKLRSIHSYLVDISIYSFDVLIRFGFIYHIHHRIFNSTGDHFRSQTTNCIRIQCTLKKCSKTVFEHQNSIDWLRKFF